MLRVRLAKEMIMMLRILLLLICLQVTGAQAQHEIYSLGCGFRQQQALSLSKIKMVRCGTGTEDQ